MQIMPICEFILVKATSAINTIFRQRILFIAITNLNMHACDLIQNDFAIIKWKLIFQRFFSLFTPIEFGSIYVTFSLCVRASYFHSCKSIKWKRALSLSLSLIYGFERRDQHKNKQISNWQFIILYLNRFWNLTNF